LIPVLAFVELHLRKCLLTAIRASKHACMNKSIVLQVDECCWKTLVKLYQSFISESSMHCVRGLHVNKLQLVFRRNIFHWNSKWICKHLHLQLMKLVT